MQASWHNKEGVKMFWNKKDQKSSLPDLPSPVGIPVFPKIGDYEKKGNSLPAFPDSPINPGFSQSAIKDAVGSKKENTTMNLTEDYQEKPFKTLEMEEWKPHPTHGLMNPFPEIEHNKPHPEESPLTQTLGHPRPNFPPKIQNEVFVKIEKFQATKKSLLEIGEKLEDIDELLKKIRETKMREEQELSAWEKDISATKSRIQDIRENIFENRT
jgi:hypothetical protein